MIQTNSMQTTVEIQKTLQSLYAPIQTDLHAAMRIFDDEIACDLPFVDELCGVVRSYRGKMLRPALLLLTARACGRVTGEHHVLAAVVEMVHMATLVHDDVLDEADERRRQPTVGSIAGNEAAVLLGDFLISHAFHLCSNLDSQEASRTIAAATNTVCEGEMLQNHLRGRLDLSEAQYFDIIGRKTAALTAAACALGARFSGACDEFVASSRRYGKAAGMAFQIIDDVLDVTGDQDAVGKTLGRDADLGKVTLPTLHALARADGDEASAIAAGIGEPGRDGRAAALRDRLRRLGSIDYAVDLARNHVRDALAQLAGLPDSAAKKALAALATFIIDRSF
ncbi:MAG: polyprenyl synthetase family protein [Phycisphaerae bacterium]